RYGVAGSIDYKLGDSSGLYLRGIYSHFNNFGDRWVYSPEVNTIISPTQGGPDGDVGFNAQIRRPVEVIGSVQAGGRHVFPRWLLAYDFSVSRSSSEDHGYSTARFDGPSNVTFGLDRSDPLRPKLIPQLPTNIFDPTTYSLSSMEVSRAYSPQVNLQGGFSAARNYSLAGHFGTFEFGAKVRNAHKFENANDFIFNADGPQASVDPGALLMSNFLDTFRNPDYYNKSYTLGPLTDFGKIRSFFNANQGNFFTEDFNATAQNTFPNNFDLIERVSAGYLMNTLDF